MRRETLGGWGMIVGSAMTLATMALHPTGHDIARDPGSQGPLSLAVHVLALLGMPLILYGTWALTRQLASLSALAELALVFQGLAAVATVMAVVASGFLATDLAVRLATLQAEARATTSALLHYTGSVIQAFARVLVASSSLAIGLWSFAMLRTRTFGRSAAWLGLATAVIALLALFSGRLRLDVHGFGAVVLAQSVWLVAVGWTLVRSRAE
jgi:hypothetical protein